MSKNCPIMKRMKKNYESRSRTFLTRRTPVIIRLDGKAFHTYTKGLDKPFDDGLIEDMEITTKYLCENIQGVKIGYCQSDEISLLLTDYDKLTTDAWFDYNVQKMVSISASMATAKFNQLRTKRLSMETDGELATDGQILDEVLSENFVLAFFDSRAFNIPKEEVSNYFKARQRDAVKNSISMLAQSLYSHKELHKKNGEAMQELCFQKGHNWNDLHYSKKRGSTIVKNQYINDKIEYKDGEPVLDGSVWYQPDGESTFYPDKRGRLLIFVDEESAWCDTPIKSIRSKWEPVETPISFDDKYFKEFIK